MREKDKKDEEMKMSDEVIQKKRERDEDDGMNSRVNKAIRGERKEGLKRSADTIPGISVRKLIRTEGEARGGITREVIIRRDVFEPKGAMSTQLII